jgi:hypothetical protein
MYFRGTKKPMRRNFYTTIPGNTCRKGKKFRKFTIFQHVMKIAYLKI